MRRLLCAALLVGTLMGATVLPAYADPIPNRLSMSFDYSDNAAPASASTGLFNVIVDVLPVHSSGLIRMVAVAPSEANVANVVCKFQWIDQNQVECSFNFTATGVWAIHAQYQVVPNADVVSTAVTNLRVGN
jgi:hypothetical protein